MIRVLEGLLINPQEINEIDLRLITYSSSLLLDFFREERCARVAFDLVLYQFGKTMSH